MKKFIPLAVVIGIATSAHMASAADDPTVAGSATIGTVPGAPGWGGFWESGFLNDPWNKYSVLTNGASTYINAPDPNGTIFFRSYNTGVVSDPDGWKSRMYLDRYSNLTVGGSVVANKGITSWDGIVSFKATGADKGIAINAQTQGANSISGAFFGSEGYGIDVAAAKGSVFRGPISIGQFDYDGMLKNGDLTLNGGDLIVNGGQAKKPGGGPWAALSDARVKRDVAEFTSGLADLEKVHVVKYKYNGLGGSVNNGTEYVGVVAQELEAIAPYMVSTAKLKLRETDTSTSDLKEVDPSAFTYMLVNAVKELSAQNAEQGKRLAYLAEQNETQSQKLAELMAQNKLMMSMIEKRLGAQSVAFTK